MSTERPTNRFAVRLSDLEDEARVAATDRVEEIAEPPNPDVIPEDRRQLENFLKWGAAGS